MEKQILLRLAIFGLVAGGMIFWLKDLNEKGNKLEKEAISNQIEGIVEEVKDFPEEKVLRAVDKFVPGLEKAVSELPEEKETEIEQKIQEIIKEIKSLPEEQVTELKKEVFCHEFCEKTCQEVCEEN
jgi:DNA-binding transcriptional regulator GbsR (MarR family)